MKYLVIICLSLAVVSQFVWGLKDSNIDYGDCDGKGPIVYEEMLRVPGGSYTEETRDICTPTEDNKIKCVEIKDLRNDLTNGAAHITAGGPGQKCVTIKFKSQYNRAMEFNITVWKSY
ncbi:unnamed protein product [Brassicogethes aeneus]|uniref:Uncharacterized protein n=1 Tax=Brassicogethes aeneus TaxID=1431903 RepID=A0A9P0FD80_BRAAE|nr:unnamed protein product [Brassicogethes aeneus]